MRPSKQAEFRRVREATKWVEPLWQKISQYLHGTPCVHWIEEKSEIPRFSVNQFCSPGCEKRVEEAQRGANVVETCTLSCILLKDKVEEQLKRHHWFYKLRLIRVHVIPEVRYFEDPNTLDKPVSNHDLFIIETRSGAKFALDPTYAQFGFPRALSLWTTYKNRNVEEMIYSNMSVGWACENFRAACRDWESNYLDKWLDLLARGKSILDGTAMKPLEAVTIRKIQRTLGPAPDFMRSGLISFYLCRCHPLV